MNRIKIIFLFISITFLSFNNVYSETPKITNPPEIVDERVGCSVFFNKLRKSPNKKVRNFYAQFTYDDYGFYPKPSFNLNTGARNSLPNKNGNLVVGQIYNEVTASKIKSGDEILSINNKKIKNIDDFLKIIYDENIKEIKVNLLNRQQIKYEVILNKSLNSYRKVKYSIKNFDISDIDIKKSTYDVTIKHSFSDYYRDNERSEYKESHPIFDLSLGTLIYFDEKFDTYSYHICDIPENEFKSQTLLDPSYKVKINNLIKNDKDLEEISSYATPYHKLVGNTSNYVKIEKSYSSVLKIKNKFNLKSFPFDKQVLKFQVIDLGYGLDTRIIDPSIFTYKSFENFLAIDDIPGWNKKSFKIDNLAFTPVTQNEGEYNDSHMVELVIERKPGYYIFKVIFPILLILLICWSVVWVDPKELEARLTITIVCLLSLIAYNFVIDSELPKLEYLTVLDWVILISYIYATIPNLLSIISFRLLKTNLPLGNKIEKLSKKYGLSSYVFLIFFIVLLNANTNIEHSSSLLSWMAPR